MKQQTKPYLQRPSSAVVPADLSLKYIQCLRQDTLVRSRLKWDGHVERMGDEKWEKRADAQKMEGKRRRGKLRM